MENRLLGLSKVLLWFGWLILTIAIAAGPFRWEMDYFLIHGNRAYYQAMLALLILVATTCAIYVRLRDRGWWRWELLLIAALALFVAAVRQPVALLIGLLLFFACFTAGHRLARLMALELEGPAEVLGMGFSIGSAALLPALFVLGLIHAYYAWVFLLLLALPLVLWRADALRGLRAIGQLYRSARQAENLRHPLSGIAVIFLAIGVFCGTVVAVSPSIAWDALNQHLPAAQYYAAQHRLQPVPRLSYSLYPQGFETLMTVAYQLGGQSAAQIVTPLVFVAFLLVLVEIARACELDSAAIVTGVAGVVMTPFIAWDGSQTKNDIGVALFQLAAVLCCLRWRNSGQRAWLLVGGALLASSMAIKYVSLFGAVPLMILFIAAIDRKKKRWLGAAAAFFLLMGILGSYWQVRAFLLTGNPVYPEKLERITSPIGQLEGVSRRERLLRLVELPWRLHFAGQKAEVTLQGFESPLGSPLGLILITFAPLTLLVARHKNGNRRACIFYVVVYLLYWGIFAGALRYALAPIALLIVLVVGKARDAYDQKWTGSGGPVRLSIAVAFVGSLAFGLLGVILVEIAPQQLSLLAGRIGRDAYLGANLPDYAALQTFQQMDRHAAVFVVDACSRAYAPDPGAFGCSSAGPATVREELDRSTFQYVAIPAGSGEERRGLFLEGWKAEQVYQDHNYVGFRIWRDR
jgi:4-amino-4-deoxy-L-arabinose transferase-like glycosyltransferase